MYRRIPLVSISILAGAVSIAACGTGNLDVGSSSAQSVVLMAAVIVLTAVQFRFLGKRGGT